MISYFSRIVMHYSPKVSILRSFEKVDARQWNRVVPEDDPFLEHEFLVGLEKSRSVGTVESGWIPTPVVAFEGGQLVGAVPLFEKYDSYGEYIFDWSWARAAHQARIPYYPKLVAAIPFTPVTGRRLLCRAADGGRATDVAIQSSLIRAMTELAAEGGVSSIHILFASAEEMDGVAWPGLRRRSSYQFHWENRDQWQSFDDYLASMRSAARKQIKKERRLAASHGLRLSIRAGTALESHEWDALWRFYRSTIAHKHAIPYLTRAFFAYVRENLAHRVVVSMAHDGNQPVAGALMFAKGKRLCGRYWGALAEYPALHFELCYYLPIAWCLEHGLTRFEAGAQGSHKLKRGFLPSECHSGHWIRHPGLDRAIGHFLEHETVLVGEEMEILRERGPFRRAAS